MATEHSTTTITGGHANAVASGAAGFMSGADKAKLDGIDAGADVTSANAPQAHAASHKGGGSDAIDNAAAGGAAGLMSGTDKTKLDGIATGADVTGSNAPQAHAASHLPGGADAVNPLAAHANLTDSAQTIQWLTTVGYARMPAGTTSVARAVTLGVTSAVNGSTWILDIYAQGHDVTIVNGGAGAGTIHTVLAGAKARLAIRFDGTNWPKGARLPLA